MHHPTDRIAHTTALVTAVVEHWLEAMFVYKENARWCYIYYRKLAESTFTVFTFENISMVYFVDLTTQSAHVSMVSLVVYT